MNTTVTAMIRPKYGERQVRVRPLFRTRIYVLGESVMYPKGSRDLGGEPLKRSARLRPGSLLVPYWGGVPRPMHLVYQTIYDAIRAQEYTADTYRAERGEIASVQMSMRGADQMTRLFLRYGKLGEEDRRRLREFLVRLAVDLERSRGAEKRAAAAQFAKAADERDSRGRTNPGARAARVVSAQHGLGKRLVGVREICQAIGPRHTALLAEQDRMWTDGWNPAWREIVAVAEELFRLAEGAALDEVTGAFEYRLHSAARALDRIDIAPYLAPRDRIVGEIREALHQVSRDRWSRAHSELRRALLGIRLQRAGRDLAEHLLATALLAHRGGIGRERFPDLEAGLSEFLSHFDQIDDSLLRHPVKADVQRLVGVACDVLVSPDDFDNRAERAKQALKEALTYL